MKLATVKTDQRDGQLVIVSRDLQYAIPVASIAFTMQQAIDNWQQSKPKLEQLYQELNEGKIRHALSVNRLNLAAPLPRAYQWADASAFVNHVELVRKSRGVDMPANFWEDPLMYQGGSDTFLGPCDTIPLADENFGLDFEAEVAVVTTDVPMGITADKAGDYIALIMLVNDVSLRNLAPGELAKGFGFFQCKPSSAFSPVAITPDELGEHWIDGKVNLPLITHYNNKLFGQPNAATDMTFNFPKLIAHAARTRALGAGTIIGSGTVSNCDRSKGSSCIVERRMLETLETGNATTPYMKHGDQVRIEMFDAQSSSIFGAINQTVRLVREREDYAKAL